MKELNEKTAGKMLHPERVIQFGEGNFLRAFVDWIIQKMNENVNFNSSVVVVQPIDRGMVDMLNAQDCLYHVNLQGLDKGEKVNSLTRIDVISRALNPYADFSAFMKLAEQPEIRFVISNSRNNIRSGLQVGGRACLFLSGQADAIALSPLQDI
jgi:tagaturonate reductase